MPGEIKEGTERLVTGVIERITPIKILGAQGKLKSIGIRLAGREDWFNIVSFSEKELKEILGDAKEGDLVELKEVYSKGYWNVKEVKKLKPERTKEKIESKIEINDIKVLEKCIQDATSLVRKMFKDNYREEERSYFSSEFEAKFIFDIAFELFKRRLK